jgi:hypothetical protein
MGNLFPPSPEAPADKPFVKAPADGPAVRRVWFVELFRPANGIPRDGVENVNT